MLGAGQRDIDWVWPSHSSLYRLLTATINSWCCVCSTRHLFCPSCRGMQGRAAVRERENAATSEGMKMERGTVVER